jgi:hypothetical protein
LAPPCRTTHLRTSSNSRVDDQWANGGNQQNRKRSSAADVAV